MPSTSSTSAVARRSNGCRISCSSCTRASSRRTRREARFTLPFSQEVIADVLGLSVPHLNRTMQQLRAEKLIANTRTHDRIPRRRRDADACALPAAGTGADPVAGNVGLGIPLDGAMADGGKRQGHR